MIKVGITGGIGSGKSTVCRLFEQKGIAVYDSDRAAKRLMAEPGPLREALVRRFGPRTFCDDALDRKYLAEIVFRDSAALADLNALVHPAVMCDFDAWVGQQQGPYVVLESAILFDSGLEAMVDRTVAVVAPLELRIERTCRRDGCDAESVRRRIAAQTDDDTLCRRADFTLVNLFEQELQGAVDRLDRRFRFPGERLWS
ncbi:MAG: dephospho-CoA kinase [Alistipes sp.]|nr:dephospho-CoA kinase [Alistipes sp.]